MSYDPVLLASVPAAVTGWGGYQIAKMQARSADRSIEARLTELERTDRDKRRSERESACATYLEADLSLTACLTNGNFTWVWFETWERDCHVPANARLLLLASDAVFEAANALYKAVMKVLDDAELLATKESLPLGAAALRIYNDAETSDPIRALRRSLVNAMREDTA